MSSLLRCNFSSSDIFSDPRADIILRSSDGVDFRTFKALLGFASPFFDGMFALPRPSSGDMDEMKDNIPVIQMEESSGPLEALLTMCHPGHAPYFETLSEVANVLIPAVKYDMAGVTKRLANSLKVYVQDEPLRVFCVAWHFRLDDTTRLAARHLLTLPIFPRLLIPELDIIPATGLHRLEEYHARCGRLSRALSTNFSWIDRNTLSTFDALYPCAICTPTYNGLVDVANGRTVSARKWWMEYMRDAGDALLERPAGSTVKRRSLLSRCFEAASACPTCSKRVYMEMSEFCDIFEREIEKALSTVELKTGF